MSCQEETFDRAFIKKNPRHFTLKKEDEKKTRNLKRTTRSTNLYRCINSKSVLPINKIRKTYSL